MSSALRRNAFAEVSRTSKVLIETLHRHGAERPVNIDGAVQCQSFDVLGSVGFGKRYEAGADLEGEGAKACQAAEQGVDWTHILLSTEVFPQ